MTKPIAIDIETTDLSHKKGKVLGVGAYRDGKYAFLPPSELPANLDTFTQVYHGGSFDCKWGIPGLRLDHCTMVLSSLLPHEEHSLEYLAVKYLKVEPWKKKYNRKHLEEETPERLREYNRLDCKYTYDLYPILRDKVKKAGQWEYYEKYAMPTARFLCELNQRGVRLDLKKKEELMLEYEAKEQTLRDKIRKDHWVHVQPIEGRLLDKAISKVSEKAARQRRIDNPSKYGALFNPNSTKQLLSLLNAYGLFPTGPDPKTGIIRPSTSEDALAYIEHPLVEQIGLLRTYKTLLSTYLGRSGKVCGWDQFIVGDEMWPNYHIENTGTGRTSSDHPNMQNVPVRFDNRLREVFIPREGFIFMDVDYAQIELMIAAHFSQDEKLMELIHSGIDLHGTAAVDMFDLPCTPNKCKELFKEERDIAKTVRYLTSYGGSSKALKTKLKVDAELNKTLSDCKDYLKRYYSVHPGLRKYTFKLGFEAEKQGYVTNLLGRKVWVPREEARHKALNYKVQPSASDLLNIAMMEVDKELLHGGRVVAIIHDEGLLEIREEDIEYTKKLLQHYMVDRIHLTVPLSIDIHVGHTWGAKNE